MGSHLPAGMQTGAARREFIPHVPLLKKFNAPLQADYQILFVIYQFLYFRILSSP